jgi:hypothetical protein
MQAPVFSDTLAQVLHASIGGLSERAAKRWRLKSIIHEQVPIAPAKFIVPEPTSPRPIPKAFLAE